MKTIVLFFVAAIGSASALVYSCDEQCLREKAELRIGVQFSSIVSWQECQKVAGDFVYSSVRSLKDFSNHRLQTKYKGPLKSVKSKISTDLEWLKICDQYLRETSGSRLFTTQQKTEDILTALEGIKRELTVLISGATYSAVPGQDRHYVIRERFNDLYKEVDEHITSHLLRGDYVYN